MANWYVSSVAYTAVSVWTSLTTLAVGAFRRQVSPTPGNERVFKVTSITTGITGASEPAWNLNNNATTTDAGVTWTQVSGQEASQSAGNWTAPIARLTQMPGGSNSIGGLSFGDSDQVFVSSDHAETTVASADATIANNGATSGKVLSVSRTGASLPPTSADLLRGASVTLATAGNTLNIVPYSGYWWGIDFKSPGPQTHKVNTSGAVEFDNCSAQLTRNSADFITLSPSGAPGNLIWTNTTVSFANSGSRMSLNGQPFEWRATQNAFQGTAPTSAFSINNVAAKVFMHGLDLSSVTGNLFAINAVAGNDIIVRDCKLANGVTIDGSTNGGWVIGTANYSQLIVDNCDDTTNDRNYRMFRATNWGAIQTETALVRTGGNSDGVTSFAWQMINTNTAVTSIGNPSRFPEIAQRYNSTGSSKTLTLYGISSFAAIPTTANMWIDVEYLGSAASPIATLVSSRAADALSAGSNLSADTSSWNGNVSARQNSHAYVVGNFISVADNTAGCTFVCTSPGTSASSEPAAYAGAVDGQTGITDGGATFKAMWRWKCTVTFTTQMAGTIKCLAKTLLSSGMTTTANLLVIDPAFTLT